MFEFFYQFIASSHYSCVYFYHGGHLKSKKKTEPTMFCSFYHVILRACLLLFASCKKMPYRLHGVTVVVMGGRLIAYYTAIKDLCIFIDLQ